MQLFLAPIAGIVTLNTAMLERALADLDRAALVRRVIDQANPMIWVAAHLTWARVGMASFLGERPRIPLAPRFSKGGDVPDERDLPERDVVLGAWSDVSATLARRLGEATPEQLAAPAPRSFPIDDKSVLGGLTFLTYHEGYHLGQLSLVRKALGHPGLVDG